MYQSTYSPMLNEDFFFPSTWQSCDQSYTQRSLQWFLTLGILVFLFERFSVFPAPDALPV